MLQALDSDVNAITSKPKRRLAMMAKKRHMKKKVL